MSTEHKHTPLPGQKSLDNKDVYIKELPIVLISKIMSEIYKKIKDKSVAITPQALISASELWNIDDADITPEITTELIDKTLDIISRAIEDRFEKELNQSKSDITTEEEEKKGSDYLEEKTQNKNLEKQTILARCKKNSAFAQNLKEHATENPALVKNIMVLFCQYLEEVSKQNFDTFKHHLFTFPPEVSADINCLNGTSRDLTNSITLMHSSDGQRDFLNAHIVSTSMIVEQLKYLVHPDYEKHIPNFVQYACGLMPENAINKIDGYYISPLSDIPAEIMWDILRSYQTNFTQIINADIADKINVMKGKIFQTCDQHQDINSLVVDAANINNKTKRYAANHTIRNINKVIDPFEVNGLIDMIDTDDETCQFKWKEKDKIEKIVRKYYLEQSPSMILLNKAQSKINVGKSQYQTQRDELAKFSNFFKPGVIDHITPLIESDNISDKVFALDALWVMADEFKGSSLVYFVQLLETLTQSKQNVLAYFNEMRNSIPKEHVFKLQKIIDRYELYTAKANKEEKDQSLYEQYKTQFKDGDLKTIIQLGVPASKIIERIKDHEDEIKQLDENSALKLLFHPQRNVVLDCLKETKPLYLKNEFLQKFLVEAARYNLEEEFLNCLDKFITDNNKEAVLSSLTHIHIILNYYISTTALHQAAINNNINIINAILSKKVDINISDPLDYSTALMIAAENGHDSVVKTLIEAKANVNKTNEDGWTALMLAADNGYDSVVQALINANADVHITTSDGWTALMIAAENGHDSVVKTLIKAKANVNKTNNDGFTALMIAAQNGYNNVVQALINANADVHITTSDGSTALMIAAKKGHDSVVQTLIEAQANVHKTNEDGWTALMIAAKDDRLNVVQTLIKAKANVNKTNNDGFTALMIAAQNGYNNVVQALINANADVHITASDGCWTALTMAAENGYLNVVNALINANADVYITTSDGYTALMLAAQNGYDSVVKTLIAAGADVHKANENDGYTALMLAAQNGHYSVVQTLIDAGADVHKANENGWTALMLAAQNGRDSVAQTLIDAGADVHKANKNGYTALMLAAQNGHDSVVQTLIEAKANITYVNKTNKNGWTALMIAAKNDRLNVIKTLIEAKANVHKTNEKGGYTALMIAALKGHEKVVKALINAGADVNKTNENGWTALMMAATLNHKNVVETLLAVPGIHCSQKNIKHCKKLTPEISQYITQAMTDIHNCKELLKKHTPKNLQDIIDVGVKYIDNHPYPTFGPKQGKEREFNNLISGNILHKDNVFITLLRNAEASAKESKTMEVKQKETKDKNYSNEKELKSPINLLQNMPSTRCITFNCSLTEWKSLPTQDNINSSKSSWPWRYRNNHYQQQGRSLLCC